MIRPPASDSLATFERVFKATGSIQDAADAVAEAAVAYSRQLVGVSEVKPRGELLGLSREIVPRVAISIVCSTLGLPKSELFSPSKKTYVTHGRHVLMWILRFAAGFTTRDAAVVLRLADQSAVYYGADVMRTRIANDERLRDEVNDIVRRIRAEVLAQSTTAHVERAA